MGLFLSDTYLSCSYPVRVNNHPKESVCLTRVSFLSASTTNFGHLRFAYPAGTLLSSTTRILQPCLHGTTRQWQDTLDIDLVIEAISVHVAQNERRRSYARRIV
jgi:hypothetical protein